MENGYSVEMPLLPGHGTQIEDMLDKTYDDFYSETKVALNRLRENAENIFVAGLSMGGTLSCNLAADFDFIKGLVLVNPLLEPSPDELTKALEDMADQGTEVITSIGSDIKKEGEKEYSYNGTPIKPLLSLFDGVGKLFNRLQDIKSDVILFSSREDHVVMPTSGDILVEKLNDRVERIWLENSYHVATLDNDQRIILEGALNFVRRHID
jgi:carboxylesterase